MRAPIQFIALGLEDIPSTKILPLTVDGRLIKRTDGTIFRTKGITAFPIINRFERGDNIDWVFKKFSRANVIRAFWYTPKEEWGNEYWELPSPDSVYNFHVLCASKGYYVYNTCLTNYASDSKINQIKEIIWKLKDSSLPNVLFEAKNEPFVHDDLNPSVLKNALSSTPYLYTSGIYDEVNLDKFWGKFGDIHTPRDNEGVRKFKDLMEFEDKLKIPCQAGEPFKPNTGFNELDFYTYAAGCGLMGTGGIFHCESMKFLSQPTDIELSCADMFFKGLDVFPLDSCLGEYRHRQDLEVIVDNIPTKALRVFQKSKYLIAVRNQGIDTNGLIPMDNLGVAYRVL